MIRHQQKEWYIDYEFFIIIEAVFPLCLIDKHIIRCFCNNSLTISIRLFSVEAINININISIKRDNSDIIVDSRYSLPNAFVYFGLKFVEIGNIFKFL